MRVATLTTALRPQNTILTLQDRLATAQQQVSTGQVAQNYSGLRGDDARVSIQLREAIDTREAFVSSIDQVRTRTRVAETALVGIQELAQEFRTELVRQQRGNYEETAPILQDIADTAIDRLAGLLNSRVEGRFLFNGTSVQTQPIADVDALKTAAFDALPALADGNSAAVIGGAATHFGNDDLWNDVGDLPPGQDRPFAFNAAEGVRLEFGDLANDDAFEEIFEVFAIFAGTDFTSGLDDEYEALVTDGLTRIEAAADDVGLKIAALGNTQSRLTEIREQHEDDTTLLSTRLNGIENVDPFEAATEFQLLQNQLQAAFTATASLRNLSLASFL